jgi:hypothetical protein
MSDTPTREGWNFPDDLLETAWVIIANASDWNNPNSEWREAAERWRDAYFASLFRFFGGDRR